jgi:peptide/nickel transport system substrate-binding protein
MFKSFEVGVRSLCVRNPDYWENGKPYVDEWEDISIDDNAARLNALLGGQIDMMSQLDFAQARAQQGKGKIKVVNAPSPAYQVFIMRTDRAPFNDVRVRQAFRLIADRQALINVALSGFGTLGNDLFGKNLPYYAESLPPRKQDIEQAKSLLKQAGKSDLAVTLQTSDIVPGFTQAATLFAQQAAKAGVKVSIKKEPANSYFDTSLLYTKMTFAQSYWTTGSLAAWYTQALVSGATWNETHFKDAAYDALIKKAIGARTVAEAKSLWNKVQKVQYDRGGYIGWANQNIVDATSTKVNGMKPSAFFNLGGFNYRDVWLTA